MNSSIDTVLLLSGKGYFLINGRTKTPADAGTVSSLKAGYRLIIDDSLLMYSHMRFPQAAGRNPLKFIENFIAAGFPQEAAKYFGYYKKGEHILIALFSPELLDRDDVKKAIEKAGSVTTQLTMLYGASDDFTHTYGEVTVEVKEGVLTHVPYQPAQTLDTVYSTASLVIPSIKKQGFGLDKYRLPLTAALLCWLLFFAGYYFRLHDKTDRLKAAEAMLNDVYAKAGTAGTPDPYGLLMAKAAKKDAASSFEISRMLEQISRTQSDAITATSIDIKGGSVTYEGKARDFAFIEDFKKSLSKETGKNVSIINTKKGDSDVVFTLRF